jgi:hypothetical protein
MLRRCVLLLTVVATGVFVFVVLAQSQERKAPSQSELKKQFAEMAEKASAPTEEHKRLAALVGEFDQAVEVRMGPGEPLKSHVLATGEWSMGGRFVQITARSAPEEELKGERLTIYGYDTRANKYTMWTIESTATFAVEATGDFDAATKTFTFEGERYGQGPGKVPFEWVLRLQDGGAFTQEILMKPAQGEKAVPVVVVKNTPRRR